MELFVCALLLKLLSYTFAGPTSTVVPSDLRCHQCSGVTDPHFCSMIVTCDPDEECHTERVLGADSVLYYNSGCQKKSLCQLAAKGKRSDLHVCEGCCATDLCNTELCPPNNSSSPGVQCYQCDEVASPSDCQNRITCADGEQCIVQKYATESAEIRYSLGCETTQRCGMLSVFGKRTTQLCNECCDTPGCNRHLCFNDEQTTTTPDSSCHDEPDVNCKLVDDAHHICAHRALAAIQYCRKYCGYCSDGTGTTVPPPTGTTIDPCRDSGDLDCRQMNESLHLCEKKDSPVALMYCPKFCGLCLPKDSSETCEDLQDFDCKTQNDSHNICAERTIAATKYCRKFCGYCNADGSPVTTLSPPTGTTLDPCRDSPSTNCNYLNETLLICSKPDAPPTAMYCPRFCGLCTPACADEPDVDCRKQNDTQNICALGTYAATHLCRKFCGYCADAGVTTVAPPTADTCKDNPDVDCAVMDSLRHICATPNDPGVQAMCPKYCGLC